MAHFSVHGAVDRKQVFCCLYPPDRGVPYFILPEKPSGLGTVMGNQGIINSAFRHSGLLNVGQDSALPALPASYSRSCPRRPRVFPQWDLSLVLMALTSASFKTFQDIFQVLTWKLFFLSAHFRSHKGQTPCDHS